MRRRYPVRLKEDTGGGDPLQPEDILSGTNFVSLNGDRPTSVTFRSGVLVDTVADTGTEGYTASHPTNVSDLEYDSTNRVFNCPGSSNNQYVRIADINDVTAITFPYTVIIGMQSVNGHGHSVGYYGNTGSSKQGNLRLEDQDHPGTNVGVQSRIDGARLTTDDQDDLRTAGGLWIWELPTSTRGDARAWQSGTEKNAYSSSGGSLIIDATFQFVMGANYFNGTPATPFDGEIQFLMFVFGSLSLLQRQQMEGWWAHVPAWSQQALLPVGHPYKSSPPT